MLGQTVANRVFVSSQALTSGAGSEELGDALSRAHGDVLGSHAIPTDAVSCLVDGRVEQFLLMRHEALVAAVVAFVNAQAEWGHRRSASIKTLLRAPLD